MSNASQLIMSQGKLSQVGIVLGNKEYLNGFFHKIMGSVYSYDGLLLMLVLIVKYIADMILLIW